MLAMLGLSSNDRYEPLPEFIKSEEGARLWQATFYLAMDGFTLESPQKILHIFKEALHRNFESSELALIIYDIDCLMAPSELTKLGIEACRRALEAEPDNPQILWALSHLYEKLLQYEQAIEVARRLVQINPSYTTWERLANILMQSGRKEEAIQIVKELVVKETGVEYWYLFAKVLREAGRLEEALEALKNVISICPQYPYAWGDMGDIYREQRKQHDAIKAYHQAVELAKAKGWEQQPIKKDWLAYWEFRLQELQAREVDEAE